MLHRAAFGVATLALFSLQSAIAQCAQWRNGFGASGVAPDPLFASSVDAQLAFDDGSGPALYVGGVFAAAGDAAAAGLARWRSGAWETIGDLEPQPTFSYTTVRVFHAHDFGAGPQLYAGGIFRSISGVTVNNIARWDGSTWQPLGQGLRFVPAAMASFDDGSGVKLFVGTNQSVGSTSGLQSSLAVWDGASWTDLSPGPFAEVNALTVFDAGAGPELFAGGYYVNGPTSLIRRVGAAWVDAGVAAFFNNGAPGEINALEVFDDGSGPALYIGGAFQKLSGVSVSNIARWDGATISPLAAGVSGPWVADLHAFDDGGGPALFVTGALTSASGVTVRNIARWRAGAWSALGPPPGRAGSDCLEDFDDGTGPALYAGGNSVTAFDVRADLIARWNGVAWSSLGQRQGFEERVNAVAAFDSGAGAELYAAGAFDWAGAASANGFAKWGGASWSAIALAGDIVKLATLDLGSGEALYACGDFTQIGGALANDIARFDGVQWSALGSGVDVGQSVLDMTTFDDGAGEALWVAGDFTSIGGAPAKRVARWDGNVWWSPSTGPSNVARALAVHDDGMGAGAQLYVGGGFVTVGTVGCFGVARWNGASWSTVGNGFNDDVVELAVFDDGNGPKLYAAGPFTSAPPVAAVGVARWDGLSWQPVGSDVSGSDEVLSFEVFDDGSGPALFAGGTFQSIDGGPTRYLAKWRGSGWLSAGQPNGPVHALASASLVAGAPLSLLMGGRFTTVDGAAHLRFGVLDRACPCPPQSYCTAGTSSIGCAPTLSTTGAPSASLSSPFTITAVGVDGLRQGLLFYGITGRISDPWGSSSSYLCVKSPTQRGNMHNSGGSFGACDGVLTLDWNSFHSTHPGALGQPFQVGSSIYCQGWYRDPPSAKLTALTNALETRICP